MKILKISGLLVGLLTPFLLAGQSTWPKEIPLNSGGKVLVYQPQIEALEGNTLSARSAVSVRVNEGDEPVFGAIWADAQLLTDKDSRVATLESLTILDVRFPNVEDTEKIEQFKTLLEEAAMEWELEIYLDEVVATLESEGKIQDAGLNTTPPKIIYEDTPSTLLLLDGEPKIEKNDDLNMEIVVNTPFFIVKNPDDNKFYLFGGDFWYVSGSVTSGWQPAGTLKGTMKDLDKAMREQMEENDQAPDEGEKPSSPPKIVVSTEPAELIQSNGEAQFNSIEGTSLLYMANTDNDILMDIDNQKYYVLLSGRWYSSSSLTGTWNYTDAGNLPADFAKIPAGSDKDGVLASVAGTPEAKEAKLDAQIPQTAKVDRNSTDCNVEYDGKPEFEPIEGTSLYLAVNTSSTVIRSNNKYFAVENGVWFVSNNAEGPWEVSTERPKDVESIPPSSSAYNTKYVYVYDVTPQYVYMGYTPGYLGCYVYGPTVVYGTGFYYRPWYGRYYYPRPTTWGFGMHYNPWSGWSMSFGFSTGFFSFSFHSGGRYGGWWGPPMYRPPYRPPYYRGGYRGGYYGRNNNRTNINIDNSTNINIGSGNRTNNLYNYRNDATTRNRPSSRDLQNKRPATTDRTRPANRPSTQPATRPATGNNRDVNTADLSNRMNNKQTARPSTNTRNNVYTDKSGNVYRKQDNGNWQQRNKSGWSNSSNQRSNQSMNRQSDMRNRSQTRTNNYRSSPSRTRTRPSGGVRRR